MKSDQRLDISGVVIPFSLALCKSTLARMATGAVLEICLRDQDTFQDLLIIVERSGDTVLTWEKAISVAGHGSLLGVKMAELRDLRVAGVPGLQSGYQLKLGDVLRLRAFLALDHLKLNLLILRQSPEAIALDRAI